MLKDLEEYLVVYNTKRPHQGRGMNGSTTLQAIMDSLGQKDQVGSRDARQAA